MCLTQALWSAEPATELVYLRADFDGLARNIVDLVRRSGCVNGQYFDEDRRSDPNPQAHVKEDQERLLAATTAMLETAGLPVPSAA